MPTPAIRNLIREDKIHQIYARHADRAGEGRDADVQPVAGDPVPAAQSITLETALGASSLKDELQDMINRGVGVVPGAGLAAGGRGTGAAAAGRAEGS